MASLHITNLTSLNEPSTFSALLPLQKKVRITKKQSIVQSKFRRIFRISNKAEIIFSLFGHWTARYPGCCPTFRMGKSPHLEFRFFNWTVRVTTTLCNFICSHLCFRLLKHFLYHFWVAEEISERCMYVCIILKIWYNFYKWIFQPFYLHTFNEFSQIKLKCCTIR